MPRHVLLVFTKPVPGREQEFNDWYDGTHLPDMLKLDDVLTAQRFRSSAAHPDPSPMGGYLAFYELDTSDPEATRQQIHEAAEAGAMPFGPSIDRADSVLYYCESISESRTH